MKLAELLQGLEGIRTAGDASVEILDLACDSRKVSSGCLFFAVPGSHVDGADFAEEAVRRGAAAIMGPRGMAKPLRGVLVEVDDIRPAMASVSARFFGNPSSKLALVGVTGTNGKTTFTYLLESILKAAGFRPGIIGTVSYRFGDRTLQPPNTTPESVDLQRILHEMVNEGCTHAVLEVSSHGLDYRRVDSCDFTCAVFTMLGRDPLAHHLNPERYFAAKARLFTDVLARSGARERIAVINRDDPYGRRLLGICPVPAVKVGRDQDADYRLDSSSVTRTGIVLKALTPRGPLSLESRLLGEVNTLNILLAAAVADRLGVGPTAIETGVRQLELVPGRLQRIGQGKPFFTLVDYAHTPDALETVLAGLRKITVSRLITVFGCGGDRDKGKRPLMGAAAARWSDLIVVTSDNPRSEPPERIVQEIRQGIDAIGIPRREPAECASLKPGEKVYTVQTDRREAIRLAVRLARPGDTVLIAGKGHEQVQILADRTVPFRDDEEIRHALRESGIEE